MTTDVAGDTDLILGLARGGNGTLVGVGAAGNGGVFTTTVGFGLARYLANGTPDPSLGNGAAVASFLGPDAGGFAWSGAVQGNDRIVAAGLYFNDQVFEDFALARYRANGTLDLTFGGDGSVTTNFRAAPPIPRPSAPSRGRGCRAPGVRAPGAPPVNRQRGCYSRALPSAASGRATLRVPPRHPVPRSSGRAPVSHRPPNRPGASHQ